MDLDAIVRRTGRLQDHSRVRQTAWRLDRGAEMKFATGRPYSDPEVTARKMIEIANSVEAVQDSRIYIELINAPMLFEHKATPAEYKAGLDRAVTPGWLTVDRSSTFVKLTQTGADLLA
jgi:hypothetical protein